MIFDLRELKKHSFQLLGMLSSDIYVTGDQRLHSKSEIFDEQTQIKESAFPESYIHPDFFRKTSLFTRYSQMSLWAGFSI